MERSLVRRKTANRSWGKKVTGESIQVASLRVSRLLDRFN